MARGILLALSIPLAGVAIFLGWEHARRPRPAPAAAIGNQEHQSSPNLADSIAVESHVSAAGGTSSETPASEVDLPEQRPQGPGSWKPYDSSEYGFEISYPADWEFNANYENNYGKPPLGHGPPEYAGETRALFGLEMDGPDQPQGGGGDFGDGAIIQVQVTGAGGNVEDWNMRRDNSWYLRTSTPADWVKDTSSRLSDDGNGAETVALDTNGFKGAIHLVCTGSNPCQPFGEEGAAYRILPSGRVLLIGWNRIISSNDFSYQKYLLPMLASFRLLN